METEVAVVFSDMLDHASVSKVFDGQVVSAGFCAISDEVYEDNLRFETYQKWNTWGKSVSLGIGSRPNDWEVLTRSINFNA